MAKKKKLTKKIIEKFDKKEIAYLTDCIIEAVLAKFESDPKLRKEYFSLCGVEDKVEENEEAAPVKPAKAMKSEKTEEPVKPAKEEKPVKEVKVAKEPVAKKAKRINKKA